MEKKEVKKYKRMEEAKYRRLMRLEKRQTKAKRLLLELWQLYNCVK